MPPSEMDLEPLPQGQTSDDLVIRLVEEMAGAAGGDGTFLLEDADLALVEERLSALRAASEATMPLAFVSPPVEPPADFRGTATVTQRRERAASADAVILEALEAAGVMPGSLPVREGRKLRPAGRAPQRRSRPTFYLTALFLVIFSVGFLALDRSWSDGVTAGLAGYWTEPVPTRAPGSAERLIRPSSRNVEGAARLPTPLTEIKSAASTQIGTEAVPGPTGWLRRKVRVYKVSADGTIDFGAPGPQDKPGGQ